MTEPEPVAYRTKDVSETLGWRYSTLKPVNKHSEPLYTAEQLHPRVKMTKKQADDFKSLHQQHDLLSDALDDIYGTKHFPMKGWITDGKIRTNETLIAGIWDYYDHKKPEGTIEIVPDMKWFVRSKDRDDEGDYAFLSGIETPDDWIYLKRHDDVYHAYPFETQDEAELWINPLTEAVQLPVEEK